MVVKTTTTSRPSACSTTSWTQQNSRSLDGSSCLPWIRSALEVATAPSGTETDPGPVSAQYSRNQFVSVMMYGYSSHLLLSFASSLHSARDLVCAIFNTGSRVCDSSRYGSASATCCAFDGFSDASSQRSDDSTHGIRHAADGVSDG